MIIPARREEKPSKTSTLAEPSTLDVRLLALSVLPVWMELLEALDLAEKICRKLSGNLTFLLIVFVFDNINYQKQYRLQSEPPPAAAVIYFALEYPHLGKA